jgi:hypothetical protein
MTFWVAILIAAGIACVGFLAYFGGDVSYQANIERIFPAGSDNAFVDIEVTNLGSSSGTPTCRVELSSPDHTVSGVGTITTDHLLSGGSSAMYLVPVTVTPHGAAQVSYGASSATCQ